MENKTFYEMVEDAITDWNNDQNLENYVRVLRTLEVYVAVHEDFYAPVFKISPEESIANNYITLDNERYYASAGIKYKNGWKAFYVFTSLEKASLPELPEMKFRYSAKNALLDYLDSDCDTLFVNWGNDRFEVSKDAAKMILERAEELRKEFIDCTTGDE